MASFYVEREILECNGTGSEERFLRGEILTKMKKRIN
jgi:hypothetical protein